MRGPLMQSNLWVVSITTSAAQQRLEELERLARSDNHPLLFYVAPPDFKEEGAKVTGYVRLKKQATENDVRRLIHAEVANLWPVQTASAKQHQSSELPAASNTTMRQNADDKDSQLPQQFKARSISTPVRNMQNLSFGLDISPINK